MTKTEWLKLLIGLCWVLLLWAALELGWDRRRK